MNVLEQEHNALKESHAKLLKRHGDMSDDFCGFIDSVGNFLRKTKHARTAKQLEELETELWEKWFKD